MTDGLVPDDFDLETAKNAWSSTPRDQRKRCPECGVAAVKAKVDKPGGTRERDEDYMCIRCGAHFDEPVVGPLPDGGEADD